MLKRISSLVILVISISLSGCTSNNDIDITDTEKNNKNTYLDITGEKFEQLLSTNEDILVIDVRTPEEHLTGHIKNSINIPVDNLEERIDEINDFKNKDIVVYCKSGNRSLSAATILTAYGFKNVFNALDGVSEYNYDLTK